MSILKKLIGKKETYEAMVTCQNCEEMNLLKIPMGIEIQEHIKELNCENCGCKLVKKKEEEE